jgi:hypothetical protein
VEPRKEEEEEEEEEGFDFAACFLSMIYIGTKN